MEDFKYYRIHRKSDNSIPLLDEGPNCPDYLIRESFIDKPKLMTFKFGKPVPRHPKIADYHSSPESIVSDKIKRVLDPLNLYRVQLIPSQIKGTEGNISGFWAIHIYNYIKCIDVENSDCEIRQYSIAHVKKLRLDKLKLQIIPLEKRLIFRLREAFSYQLFHVSIVEAILKTKPDGVGFTDIETWSESSLFQNQE
jgi:hypothetical protein